MPLATFVYPGRQKQSRSEFLPVQKPSVEIVPSAQNVIAGPFEQPTLVNTLCQKLMKLPIIEKLTSLLGNNLTGLSSKNIDKIMQLKKLTDLSYISSTPQASIFMNDAWFESAEKYYVIIGHCIQLLQYENTESIKNIIFILSDLKLDIESEAFKIKKNLKNSERHEEASRVTASIDCISRIIFDLHQKQIGQNNITPIADSDDSQYPLINEDKRPAFKRMEDSYRTLADDNITVREWGRDPDYLVNGKKWNQDNLIKPAFSISGKKDWSSVSFDRYGAQLMACSIIPFFTASGFSMERARYLSHAMTQFGVVGATASMATLFTIPLFEKGVRCCGGNSHQMSLQGNNERVMISVKLPISINYQSKKFIGSGMQQNTITPIILTIKVGLCWPRPGLEIPMIESYGFDCHVEKITAPGTTIYLPDFVKSCLPTTQEFDCFLAAHKARYLENAAHSSMPYDNLTVSNFDSTKPLYFNNFINLLGMAKNDVQGLNKNNEKLIICFLRVWCNALLTRGLPGYEQFKPYDGDSIAMLYRELCASHKIKFTAAQLAALSTRIEHLIENTDLIHPNNIVLGRGQLDIDDYKTYVSRQFNHMMLHLGAR